MSKEISSSLPMLVVLIPAGAGVLVFILGRFTSWLKEALALIGSVAALACAVGIAAAALDGRILLSFGKQFYADALSALLVVLVSLIGFLATVYSLRYMRSTVQEGGLPHTTTEGRLTVFYGWLMLFLATMLWACLSNNIIMLYVAVEASTIASGLLVAFYWDKRALEAGYKYLMLLTVGITFALFGCVLVYAAGASTLGGSKGLLMSELKTVASGFPLTTVILGSAFLIV
ncbi:MAG: oxidoreductase, partial [Armatimonadota bacterium]